MKTYHADIRVLFRIQVALLFPSALLLFVCAIFLPRFGNGFWVAVLFFSGTYAFTAFLWLPRFFANLRVVVSREQVSLHSGVFTRVQRTLRMDALQYCVSLKAPRFSFLGINLVVASAPGARLVLPFLTKQNTEEIVAMLNRRLCSGYHHE